MRIRLSNGRTIGTSSTDIDNTERVDPEDNYIRGTDGAPSKRQVKHLGGGMKRHNSRRSGTNVGGYTDATKAIYAPSDTPMCVVRTTSHSDARLREWERQLLGLKVAGGEYTWEVGGSCSTGYIGGR